MGSVPKTQLFATKFLFQAYVWRDHDVFENSCKYKFPLDNVEIELSSNGYRQRKHDKI